MSERYCPECGNRMRYDDDRDEEGEIEQAWYECSCGYQEPA